MNVLFLTLVEFETLRDRNIYTDLLREFIKNGHRVYAISAMEKRKHKKTHLVKEENAIILRLQIGNIQRTNIIEKGISTVLIEPTYKKAIKTHFSKVKFDLILYSTPPITFESAIEYVKKRDEAKTYLLLKDIFPQNAVDIGMLSKSGMSGLLYRHFRKQEKRLYAISDRIGCMSQANVDYVIKHNPEINTEIVEVCPNAIEIMDKSVVIEKKEAIRGKYGIPLDKKVFIYGGNLGKPQGIPFIKECLKKCSDMENVFFLIIGSGTEYEVLEKYANMSGQKNLKLMKSLKKDDYDDVVAAADVGMIFLDYRFTIPNFPSRLLSYMQAKLPVIAATDPNTDIRNVITGIDNKGNKTHEPFGWWCESKSPQQFLLIIKTIRSFDIHIYGNNGYDYLNRNYSVNHSCNIILKSIGNDVV